MKRLVSLLTGLIIVVMLAALIATPIAAFAQDGHGEDEGDTQGDTPGDTHAEDAEHFDDIAPLRGAAVYAEFCQACHGPQGEAIGTSAAFPAIEFDGDTAHDVIVDGMDTDEADNIAMPGYGKVLSDDQISDVIAYMETWESGKTPALPEPHITVEVEHVPDYFGDAQAGAEVYAKFCAGCHGAEGEGRHGDAFPKLDVTMHSVRAIAAKGAESIYMPGFGSDSGGPLTAQQLDDLETYLASWELAEDTDEADKGVAVMIVVLGLVAILTVGAAYLVRAVPETKNKRTVV